MANIDKYLDDIKIARYGKDVRNSIHDALNEMNIEIEESEVSAATSARSAEVSAQEAAESASNAKRYENSARSCESMASEYKSNAENAAERAYTSEQNAKVSEENALNCVQEGSKQVEDALTYANMAKGYANEATLSSTNASNAADTATAKALEASTSAQTAAVKASEASTNALNASKSASAASESETNAEYYCEQAKSISESFSGALRPMGTVTFANLPGVVNATEGDMYNVSDQFTTTSAFKEGSGVVVPAGSNVYKTADGYWDVLAGSPVTGVKGNAETYYRKGNVNITPANIGLGNVPNVSTNDQTPTYSQASTLANLVSGEKISISFGKIMKAIADLISHLANKSNPHGVSLATFGINATATEINCCDGVTGNIQTQLNAKAPTTVATTTVAGLMAATDKSKLDGIAAGANKYSLPAATGTTMGGVRVTDKYEGTSFSGNGTEVLSKDGANNLYNAVRPVLNNSLSSYGAYYVAQEQKVELHLYNVHWPDFATVMAHFTPSHPVSEPVTIIYDGKCYNGFINKNTSGAWSVKFYHDAGQASDLGTGCYIYGKVSFLGTVS